MKPKAIDDDLCPSCDLERESTFHAIWSCSRAQDVWGDANSCFQKCSLLCNSFISLFEECMLRFYKDMECFVVIARKIWLRRNAFIFEGSFMHPSKVLKRGDTFLSDFRRSARLLE